MRFVSGIPVFAAAVMAAGSNPEQAGSPLTLESLRVIHQLDGWREEAKGGFIPFDHEKLFELINGGAPEYIEQGLLRGFFQRLTGSGGCIAEIYVEDFGTHRKAETMLRVKREGVDSAGSPAGFDSSKIIVFPAIGAQVAYGAIDRFYFEATVTGSGKKALIMLQKIFLFYDTVIHAGMKNRTKK